MKITTFFLSFSVLLAGLLPGCGSGSGPASAENDTLPAMTDSLLKPSVADLEKAAADSTPLKTATGVFKGRVFTTSNYCGGAAPSPEILEQARKPRPWGNGKLFLRPGSKNQGNTKAEIFFVTDENGNFSISLPSGKWCLVAREQNETPVLHQELYEHSAEINSPDEYQKWWKECRFTFDLPGDSTLTKQLTFPVNCMTESLCPWVENPQAKRLP